MKVYKVVMMKDRWFAGGWSGYAFTWSSCATSSLRSFVSSPTFSSVQGSVLHASAAASYGLPSAQMKVAKRTRGIAREVVAHPERPEVAVHVLDPVGGRTSARAGAADSNVATARTRLVSVGLPGGWWSSSGRVHVLRHTSCSRLAMLDVPAMSIKELAGHANLQTTQRYLHLSSKAKGQAIAALDSACTARWGQGVPASGETAGGTGG